MSRTLTTTTTGLQKISIPDDVKSIVVALQGLRCDSPKTWAWLKQIPNDTLPQPAIYSFTNHAYTNGDATWQDLLATGDELVTCLEEILKKHEAKLPIVLVSHGLGGMVTKKALCLISEQRLQHLSESIAATVFLGTPHSRTETGSAWNTAHNLLRPRSRLRRGSSIGEQDARRLAELCSLFEKAAMDVPVLSVVEDHESAGASKRFSFVPARSATVVGGQGITGSKREEELRVSADHASLCYFDTGSQEFQQMINFLKGPVATVLSKMQACSDTMSTVADLFEPTIGSPTRQSVTDLSSIAHEVAVSEMRSDDHDDRVRQVFPVDNPPQRQHPSLPCHSIPYERNEYFFGRQDLLYNLQQHLYPNAQRDPSSSSEELKTFAICGPGGMGKTQTAAQFALSSTNVFEAILWMRADTHAKLATDFSRVAVELGLLHEGDLDAKNLAVTRDLVKGWLSNPVRKKDRGDRLIDDTATWLLIFDNADDDEILSDFWPSPGSVGSVLVTSRDPRAKTPAYRVGRGEDLQPFSIDESANLLMLLTQRAEEDDQRGPAIQVAETLRGFPLALTQMAGVMTAKGMSFDAFLRSYDEQGNDEMFELRAEARPGSLTYQHTLTTVFSLDNLKPNSLRLLEFLSLIDSDISETDILEPVLGKIKLSSFPNTAVMYEQAREELTRSSLLSHNRTTRTLSVNILVQDAACARMSSYQFVPVFIFAVRLLSKLWPVAGTDAITQDNRRWKECEKLSQHALRLRDRFSKQAATVKDKLALSTQFASLMNEVGWYLQERGQTQLAIECFTIARDHLKKIIAEEHANPGDKRPAHSSQIAEPLFSELGDTNTSRTLESGMPDTSFLLAETYRNLGTSAADICDVKTSYENYLEYNKLMTDQLGDLDPPRDPRLAISYLELAVAHAFRLDYEESRDCSETALALCKWIPSPEMVTNLRTLAVANLALALLELGDVSAARDKALAALHQREARLGVGDRTSMLTGRLLHALGNIYNRLGDAGTSLSYHMRAMEHYRETVGPSHHRTADMCFKVAQHQYRAGHFKEAKHHLDTAQEIYQKQKQHYKAERARVLHWKAKLLPPGEKVARMRLAADMLRNVRLEHGVEETGYEESDFDRMVVFWSR